MIKSPFIGLQKPVFRYSPPSFSLEDIAVPNKLTLLVDQSLEEGESYAIKNGDAVKTGQKLQVINDKDTYAIATATGTITDIKPLVGDFGQTFTAITIEKSGKDELENQFNAEEADLNSVIDYCGCLPGNPCFKTIADNEIHTIVINSMDQDLMANANLSVTHARPKDLTSGIAFLKEIEGVERVILAVPERMLSIVNSTKAEIVVVGEEYPSALPAFLIKNIFDIELLVGQKPEDEGIAILSAESVANLGLTLKTGALAMDKVVTVVRNNGSTTNVKARIGTPVKYIFNKLGIETAEGDRVIHGGPMRGGAIYSDDFPVQACTDCLMVQKGAYISKISDYPCINCGECVRICPASVPVNTLVPYLENARYEEAAELCDLNSCVECGLCAFVCPAKMPIFQYIKLGKYELAMMESDQETEETEEIEETPEVQDES